MHFFFSSQSAVNVVVDASDGAGTDTDTRTPMPMQMRCHQYGNTTTINDDANDGDDDDSDTDTDTVDSSDDDMATQQHPTTQLTPRMPTTPILIPVTAAMTIWKHDNNQRR